MKRMIDEKKLQFVKDVKVDGVSVVSNGTAWIADIITKQRISINSVDATSFNDTVSTTALGGIYTHQCYFIQSGQEYIITIQATSNSAFTSLQKVLEWLSIGTYTVAGIMAGNKEGIIFKTNQSDQYDFDLYIIA